MKKLSRFNDWVDGELDFPLSTLHDARPERHERGRHHSMSDSRSLSAFSKVYALLCLLVCLLLVCTLLAVAAALPGFGSEENPTVNEVSEHYVGQAEHETGAENVIAGMILNYRGFDTFGPFKLIGGIAKGHPTQSEIDGAVEFYGSLAE